MTNAKRSAYPSKEFFDDGTQKWDANQGLTKREWFAGMALQGIMANSYTRELKWTELAEIAVKQADQLLIQLDNK